MNTIRKSVVLQPLLDSLCQEGFRRLPERKTRCRLEACFTRHSMGCFGNPTRGFVFVSLGYPTIEFHCRIR